VCTLTDAPPSMVPLDETIKYNPQAALLDKINS